MSDNDPTRSALESRRYKTGADVRGRAFYRGEPTLERRIHEQTMPAVVWECPSIGLLLYREPRHSRWKLVHEQMRGGRRETLELELTATRARALAQAILAEEGKP